MMANSTQQAKSVTECGLRIRVRGCLRPQASAVAQVAIQVVDGGIWAA